MFKQMNSHYAEAHDYKYYRVVKQSKKLNSHSSGKIAKSAKLRDVHMKSAVFKPLDPILILSLLQSFNTACDANGIHERAGIWQFKHFVKGAVKAALTNRKRATENDDP